MATYHYKFFAKDPDTPRVSILSRQPSLEIIKSLLERESDPNHPIKDALRLHSRREYSVWAIHLKQRDRTSDTWIAISRLLLESGADPTLLDSDTPDIPTEIADLVHQKTKEMDKKRKKDPVGSKVKFGKWLGMSS